VIAILVDAASVIERECQEQKLTQRSVAMTVALALRGEKHGHKADWARINAAIRNRWPKGLDRVKKLAWKMAEGNPHV
jgi:hypothetical protein